MKSESGVVKVRRYDSPLGELVLGAIGDKLCVCGWRVEKQRERVDRRLMRMLKARIEEGTSVVIESASRQLDEYFAGERKAFDIPLLFVGTDFQKKVWNGLLGIP